MATATFFKIGQKANYAGMAGTIASEPFTLTRPGSEPATDCYVLALAEGFWTTDLPVNLFVSVLVVHESGLARI